MKLTRARTKVLVARISERLGVKDVASLDDHVDFVQGYLVGLSESDLSPTAADLQCVLEWLGYKVQECGLCQRLTQVQGYEVCSSCGVAAPEDPK